MKSFGPRGKNVSVNKANLLAPLPFTRILPMFDWAYAAHDDKHIIVLLLLRMVKRYMNRI